MLTTDAQGDVRARLAAALGADQHQLADAVVSGHPVAGEDEGTRPRQIDAAACRALRSEIPESITVHGVFAGPERQDRIAYLLERVGLSPEQGRRYPHEFSGGQRQRIAIARAFLTDPRILILDDSTSAIDSATEDRIQRAMRRISAQRTTFLITHRLSQIRWADQILVLDRGTLVDQGSHEELMARCADYRRIFARYE